MLKLLPLVITNYIAAKNKEDNYYSEYLLILIVFRRNRRNNETNITLDLILRSFIETNHFSISVKYNFYHQAIKSNF